MKAMQRALNFSLALGILFSANDARSANKITPQEAYAAALTNRGIIVDVREKSEIMETGIADLAIWLPSSSIETRGQAFEDALKSWPKEQKLIFYCRSGRRSEKAADLFSKHGYRTFNAGSIQDWIDAELPVKPFPENFIQ